MPKYMLQHHHRPEDCRVAYAAWRGFDSPLRHHDALASCANGTASSEEDHHLWWTVEAPSEAAALEQLPEWVAQRTSASPIREVPIP